MAELGFALRSGNSKLSFGYVSCFYCFFLLLCLLGDRCSYALEGKERDFRKGDSSGAKDTQEGFLTEVRTEGFSYMEGGSVKKNQNRP